MGSTQGMSEPTDWQGIAYNQATASDNKIHSDEVAKRYGFRGGLVPGVTVYAYLVHPAVTAWGIDWLRRGTSNVVLKKPLYDRSTFRSQVKLVGPRAYDGEVIDPDGIVCADGRVELPEKNPEPEKRRGDSPVPAQEKRPDATREVMEGLREGGMGSIGIEWNGGGEFNRYVRDLNAMPEIVRPGAGGFANASFALGLANCALAANVRLGPWIHVQSRVTNHAPIHSGSRLVVESRVADLFERSGHEFVDLDVTAFLLPDTPAMSVSHRAIYRLREP